MSYIKQLQKGLDNLLKDPNCFFIGEDISDPYGGAFKVSKGLSVKYPEQVLPTPMSEQGFTGMGIGMSLAGLKVIVEIMFGDFITLCADQMINHASKFVGLYNKPMHFVLRTPMGGYRGYGATHSQSLEKMLMGMPHIFILSPSVLSDPGKLLEKSVNFGFPILFIENKLDYSRYLFEETKQADNFTVSKTLDNFPLIKTIIKDEDNSDYALVCYGGLTSDAINMVENIYLDEEISVHLFTPTQLYPVQEVLINSLSRYKNIVILEEGYSGANWGSEICLELTKSNYTGKIYSFSANCSTIEASEHLELKTLPNLQNIYNLITGIENE